MPLLETRFYHSLQSTWHIGSRGFPIISHSLSTGIGFTLFLELGCSLVDLGIYYGITGEFMEKSFPGAFQSYPYIW